MMTMAEDRERWSSLIGGTASVDEKVQLLSAAGKELAARVEASPEAVNVVLSILERRLEGKVDENTWDVLDRALNTYLGTGPSLLLTWLVLAEPGDTSRLEDFEEFASPEVMSLVRTVVGTYDVELRDAFDMWRQPPDDWKSFWRDVYQDQLTNTPLIRIRLQKYNGQYLMLEGPPNSFLSLARNIVLTLQLVATPEVFAEDLKDTFEEAVTRLQRLMASDNDLHGGTGDRLDDI
jgi:hypothetical protein